MRGYIDTFTTISLEYTNPITEPVYLVSDDDIIPLQVNQRSSELYELIAQSPIVLNKKWWLEFGDVRLPVISGQVVRTAEFDERFARQDCYGAEYNQAYTTFKVWSPVASKITLFVNHEPYEMNEDKGNWSITLQGDYLGAIYFYGVEVNHEYHEVIDPYAKGLTINATAGVVVNPEVAPDGFNIHSRPILPPADSIIYEVHVRDFSMHPNSGIPQDLKGKFEAMTLSGTTTKHGYSTGFDYVKSLGITHIELLPVNDFAKVDDVHFTTSYNWGYDPMYFQTPDGSYSTDPKDPVKRVLELKSLVQRYHKAHIGVILDVVFNHVFHQPTSSFERLVPGYYFRYYSDLSLSNGTGVGNDFASERQMARQFILDTLHYYAQNFQVDGFRFDLMGAIDVKTMQQVEEMLTALNPNMLILGEGWHLNTALPDNEKTTHDQAYLVPQIHFFNDYFRDTLKGNNFDIGDTGYINGSGRFRERVFKLFQGDYGLPVEQTINYTEVHDNHTLFDRLSYTSKQHPENVLKLHQMTTVFTILSQGIPFIHAGQEFYRTKYGHGNTYNLSDFINRIDWNRRIKYNEDITIIRKAIQLKKAYEVFHLQDALSIKTRIIEIKAPDPVLGILLFDLYDEFILFFNPTALNYTIELPRLGVFNIELSNVHSAGQVSKTVTLKPFECLILRKTIY
ncbi:type I pullulanase [Macrococcus brunensis]|uniref:type I pullulanase n=1 Tax=Macrococcus brunensis TaxID=198483 RepID=UPI001EEF9D47|nr:type I pullulanase [Macrococcus brunensis]ULG72821.1 type I pullulanase [Macrococcus brunensis]